MKFKMIFLITLLLAIFAIGAVSAANENTTNEVISIENDNEAIHPIDLDEKSKEATLTANNEDNILGSEYDDVLSDSNTKKLTVKPIKVYANEKFTYSVKLTDNDDPISGEELELVIFDGEDSCTAFYAITNYDGIATFNMDAEPIGTYDITVEGGDVWGDSYINVIENPKTKTVVKAPKVTAYYNANKYFKVTVKKGGKAVKNLKLNVKVYTGSKYKNYIIKTNTNGVAQLSTKKFKIGSHKVTIISKNSKYKLSKTSKIVIKKKIRYTSFKSPSGYEWKIKTSTWNKMKKQANNWYKRMKKVGSSLPGYSNSVKVKVIRGDAAYGAIALAVKNHKGIRCQIRGLPNGLRTSNWGDEW